METSVQPKYWPLSTDQRGPITRWRPGLRYFPWIGGLSLAAVFALIAAAVAVIVVSDNKAVTSWRLEPAVLLAAISSVLGGAMSICFSQGAAIAWWRATLHGATLIDLHHMWNFGRASFYPTSQWSRVIVKMALVAAITTLAAIVNNPLLQRATRVVNGFTTSEPSLSMDLMDNPLAQSYGYVQQGMPANTLLFINWIHSVQDWYNKTAIGNSWLPGYVCDGTCEGSITVPGIDYNCSTQTALMNLGDSRNAGDAMFSINFTRYVNDFEQTVLGLDVVYSSSVDDQCVATMMVQHCDISAALVERQIQIQNQTITLQDGNQQVLSRYYTPWDATDLASGHAAGPLSMLHWIGVYYFESSFTLDFGVSGLVAAKANGIVPVGQQYELVNENNTSPCRFMYKSPVADILRAMEEVLFRMAYEPRENVTMQTQTFLASQVSPALVFESNYMYLGIAVGVLALAMLALLVPLWGWWQLGRKVSMSPLEIGKAFGAPVLKDVTLSNDAEDILCDAGDVRVRYGQVVSYKESTGTTVSGLEIGLSERVREPVKGQVFGELGRRSVVTTTELY